MPAKKTYRYSIKAPNGQTYVVTTPNPATPDEVEAALFRIRPDAQGPGRWQAFQQGIDETKLQVFNALRSGLQNIGVMNPPTAAEQRQHANFQRMYAPRRQAAQQQHPNYFAGGQLLGDVAATVPMLEAGGAGVIRLGKEAAARGAPVAAKVADVVGTALQTSGFKTGLLPTRAAIKEGLAEAPTMVQRLVDMAVRGTAGGATGAGTAALTGHDEGMGALIGTLMPTVGSATFRTVTDKVLLPFWERVSGQLGVQRAAAIFRDAFNMTIQEAKAFARSATADMPFADALARAGKTEPTVQAMGRMVAEGAGKPVYSALTDAEVAANQATLDAMRRGTTAGESQAALMEGKAAANAEYRPRLDEITSRANLGGQVIPSAEAAAAQMRNIAGQESRTAARLLTAADRNAALLKESGLRMPAALPRQREIVAGLENQGVAAGERSVQAGDTARDIAQQLADYEAQGIRVLESGPIAAQIRALTRQEDVAGDRTLTNALNDLAGEIESHGQIIRAGVLDTLYRKAGDRVARFMDNPNDLSGLSKYSGKVLSLVKPMITQAIEGAGGTGFGALKTEYGSAMGEQGRQAFAGTLADIYRKGAGGRTAFKDVVEGTTNADLDVVAKGFPQGGPRNWDINEMMGVRGGAQGPSRIPALNQIAGDVNVRNMMAKQADVGLPAAEQLLKAPPNEIDIFHRYSPVGFLTNLAMGFKTMGANKVVDFAEMLGNSGLSAKTQQALVEGFRNGGNALDLLNTLPMADRAQMGRRLMSNPVWAARAQTGLGVTNAMAPPSQQDAANPPYAPR